MVDAMTTTSTPGLGELSAEPIEIGDDREPDPGPSWSRWFGRVDHERLVTLMIVLGVTLFVVWNVRPWSWFIDTTPTGGDLGAHVWAPAFLA